MAKIYIGTSGYDYLDWKGCFYPETIKRQDFLGFYSEQFSTLELNFSYYKMPSSKQLAGILDRSQGKLQISIKAHESLTHRVDSVRWKDSAAEFIGSLDPLMQAEKLAAVLMQFPYSFHYTPDNRRYLDLLLKQMHAAPLVVEFRNAEWLNKRVFDALRNRNVGFCSVDTPRLRGLPAPVDIVTSDIAYIRFHGRNENNWWGSDAAARFDYKYNKDELMPWIDRIAAMLQRSQSMHVFFNNHRRGQAPADAKQLQQLLQNQNLSG